MGVVLPRIDPRGASLQVDIQLREQGCSTRLLVFKDGMELRVDAVFGDSQRASRPKELDQTLEQDVGADLQDPAQGYVVAGDEDVVEHGVGLVVDVLQVGFRREVIRVRVSDLVPPILDHDGVGADVATAGMVYWYK